MEAPVEDPREETITDLVGRLIDDARTYARAEADLLREVARHRVGRARNGAIALAVGAVLLFAALIALVIGLVLGLATLIHPLLAGLAVAAVLALVGYLLVRTGLTGLRALDGDEEERKAIERGEQLP